mmetsp:Transcript_14361/g.20338  ORF Transcript_14361/g.20338 Transcript_14361/m.20338 type:complete len:1250 (-) Transcript_14361:58-3807(-)
MGSGKDKDAKKSADSVSIFKLFSLATKQDKIIIAIGTTAALISGLAMPAFIIFFGKILDELNDGTSIKDGVNKLSLIFLIVGVFSMISNGLYVMMFTISGERQSLKIKETYVHAIIHQDIGWFDEHPAGQLPTTVVSLMAKVQDGLGRKLGDSIMNFFGAVFAIIAAFYLNPILSLILLCSIPLIGASVGIVASLMSKANKEGTSHYSQAGGVANEVIGGMRTVASLCAEQYEISRYRKHLLNAEKSGIKQAVLMGIGSGALFMSFFLAYALAFWYGIIQVSDDLDGCDSNCTSGGKVISAVFGIVIGAMMLGQSSPGITALQSARSSAVTIFETIDRKPAIDASSVDGLQPSSAKGDLRFEEVAFHYPARPDDPVYNCINLDITEGESIALVGPSGGGKSTMTKLLLRFYDPTKGSIKLDGNDIKSLNVNWYRQQIGYVGQEPILFDGSIRDNISNGKAGATDDEVIAAAKAANAHDFIRNFPKAYATNVGEGGLQLSGGQKQRVAIARAIIKDPSIILLDEATSALDSQSEKVVQNALDRLHELKRRTTITIAHRLSTIQNCDRIAVIAEKGISELGTHASLLAQGGIYANLCRLQGADDDVYEEREKLGRESSRKNSTKRQRSQSDSVMMNVRHSQKSEDLNKDNDDEELTPLSRIWKMNLSELGWIFIGLLGAIFAGSLMPLEGLIMANIQDAFYITDKDKMRDVGFKWTAGFVGLAGLAIIGYIMLTTGFAVSSERLTRRLREMAFESILRHDIGWFDQKKNSTGILTANLESDANAMALATGTALGHKVHLVMTLLIGLVIGLVYAWQIGLISVGLIPLIGFAAIMQMAMLNGAYGDEEGLDGGSSASSILSASLNGITTVHAFNMQKEICTAYHEKVKDSIKGRIKRGIYTGLAFGYSQGIIFWVFALLFYVGAILVEKGTLTFLDFYVAMLAIIFGAFGVGQINADFGAQKKGQKAATRILALKDSEFKIDPMNESGSKLSNITGKIQFNNIVFAYPERPDQYIYGSKSSKEGFCLDVNSGETVALVGPSGSGKSTCIALLMRFYDPHSGSIELDGRNINELNLHWLRKNMGYVGQEPVLFTGTIMENILRGNPEASKDDVEEAAKASNAHNFIMEFDKGYETDVGEKSALLSGGQKQRIAIARAILGNPSILLLDEATSALDNESEYQVQAALDHLQSIQKRTTLVVAHRLTTIRNADKIAVLGEGKVKELGNHEQLMSQPGSMYAKLYREQTEKFRNNA